MYSRAEYALCTHRCTRIVRVCAETAVVVATAIVKRKAMCTLAAPPGDHRRTDVARVSCSRLSSDVPCHGRAIGSTARR